MLLIVWEDLTSQGPGSKISIDTHPQTNSKDMITFEEIWLRERKY